MAASIEVANSILLMIQLPHGENKGCYRSMFFNLCFILKFGSSFQFLNQIVSLSSWFWWQSQQFCKILDIFFCVRWFWFCVRWSIFWPSSFIGYFLSVLVTFLPPFYVILISLRYTQRDDMNFIDYTVNFLQLMNVLLKETLLTN